LLTAKNYQNRFMCVKVIARQSSDILRYRVVVESEKHGNTK